MSTRLIAVTALLVLATSSSAWAAWGCGAKNDGNGWGTSWNSNSKEQASELALKACAHGTKGWCSIISCSPNVDTETQSDALWPPPSAAGYRCGSPGEPKCK
jgi:hypothetical protein